MFVKRALSILAIVIAAGYAIIEVTSYQSSQDPQRVIAIYVTSSIPPSQQEFSGRAGSVDLLKDQSSALALGGWVSPAINEIQVVLTTPKTPFTLRMSLLPRPDVAEGMQDSEYLYSGFETVLPGVSEESVQCVIFSGSRGSQLVSGTREDCSALSLSP